MRKMVTRMSYPHYPQCPQRKKKSSKKRKKLLLLVYIPMMLVVMWKINLFFLKNCLDKGVQFRDNARIPQLSIHSDHSGCFG